MLKKGDLFTLTPEHKTIYMVAYVSKNYVTRYRKSNKIGDILSEAFDCCLLISQLTQYHKTPLLTIKEEVCIKVKTLEAK